MGGKSDQQVIQTTKPVIPSWLESGMQDYVKGVTALGNRDPAQYVAPPSSLQQMALSRAAQTLGGAKPTASGSGPAPIGSTTPKASTGQGLFSQLGVTPTSYSGNPTASPDGILGAGKSIEGLPNSLSEQITGSGHNPSLYEASLTGDYKNPQWWVEGGLDPGASFGSGINDKVTSALGLGKASRTLGGILGTRQKAQDNIAGWGSAQDNGANAGQYDYSGYVDAYPDLKAAYDNLNDRDRQFVLASYDVNGDGNLSQGEYGQFHYEQSNLKNNEGRAIKTPQQSYADAQMGRQGNIEDNFALETPNAEHDYRRPMQPGGALEILNGRDMTLPVQPGGILEQTYPQYDAIDSQGMYREAADLARQAANSTWTPEQVAGPREVTAQQVATPAKVTAREVASPTAVTAREVASPDKVSYRTFDPSRVEARLNPYKDAVVDAAGAYFDEQLGRQLTENQSQATLNGAYGGSRHGVADAELRRLSSMDRANLNSDLLYRGWNDAVAGDERETQGILGADTFNATGDYNARRANADADFGAQTFNATGDYNARRANADADFGAQTFNANSGYAADVFNATQRTGADQFNATGDYAARRDNATRNDAAAQANRDNLLKSSGILGDVATAATQNEIATINAMLQAGETERALDTAMRTGDINLLAQIGQMLGINVQDLIGRSTTGPGANGSMNTIGGAATGAQIGGQYGGGWGALLGGIGGGILGSQ